MSFTHLVNKNNTSKEKFLFFKIFEIWKRQWIPLIKKINSSYWWARFNQTKRIYVQICRFSHVRIYVQICRFSRIDKKKNDIFQFLEKFRRLWFLCKKMRKNIGAKILISVLKNVTIFCRNAKSDKFKRVITFLFFFFVQSRLIKRSN